MRQLRGRGNIDDQRGQRGEGLVQPDWMPRDRSWLGVPLFSKDNVIGLLALSRVEDSFNEDDGLLATTFGLQATVALENARLYEEVTGINQVMSVWLQSVSRN